MAKFYRVAIILISSMFFLSCSNEKKNQTEKVSIDVGNLSYSIEEEYAKYSDSINAYSIDIQNLPRFITEYYEEFDNTFKHSYYLHYPTPSSRRSSVYTKLFFKCKSEKLDLIKTELEKKNNLTNLDSLIIDTIDYVLSKKD
ncbi:hypothetical protein [Kordia sp. SMS9]|uniref:hypothetical protein n=1 Tax=Kordia sp. SMS9 TaxID=2282170 RepID=UPI0013B37111|nr:hypothetical protein [Kordia sp. SMS9]